MRFRGEHNQRVDDKCRLSIPSHFRQLLEAGGNTRLVAAKSKLHRCIEVWAERDWEAYEDKVSALPQSDPVVQRVRQHQIASAQPVEPDSHGRIVLAPALRAWAGIAAKDELVVVGQINWFEIWAGEAWGQKQRDLEQALAGDGLTAWIDALAERGL